MNDVRLLQRLPVEEAEFASNPDEPGKAQYDVAHWTFGSLYPACPTTHVPGS